jgi:hypothetical protein
MSDMQKDSPSMIDVYHALASLVRRQYRTTDEAHSSTLLHLAMMSEGPYSTSQHQQLFSL